MPTPRLPKSLLHSQTRSSRSKGRYGNKLNHHLAAFPSDLWTLLLPFLTWRDTTRMSGVCNEWRRLVTTAKQSHPEWRTTVLGPSVNSLASLDLLQTNHLNWADTQFAPNFILLSAASNDLSPWHRGKYWDHAIATLEKARLLPPKCRIVGMLTRYPVLGSNGVQNEDRKNRAVSLSVIVAHLPDTTLEMAQFDKYELRRAQQGVELDNPLLKLKTDDLPCFLLFGVNNQSACQLVSMVEKWYPGAAIIGTVSPFTDQCIPLATYCKHESVNHQQRQSRKHKGAKHDHHVTFPSTMLLRLVGTIGFQPFSASGYHPITPVVQYKCLETADSFRQVPTYEVVSMQTSESRSLLDVVEPSERLQLQHGRALTLFSCSDSVPLSRLVHSSTNDLMSSARITRLEFVMQIQNKLILSAHHRDKDQAYGVLASHHPRLAALAFQTALTNLHSNLSPTSKRAFGAFVLAGSTNQGDNALYLNQVLRTSHQVFPGVQVGGWMACTTIGPLALWHGRYTCAHHSVQTHTTCGAVLLINTRP